MITITVPVLQSTALGAFLIFVIAYLIGRTIARIIEILPG